RPRSGQASATVAQERMPSDRQAPIARIAVLLVFGAGISLAVSALATSLVLGRMREVVSRWIKAGLAVAAPAASLLGPIAGLYTDSWTVAAAGWLIGALSWALLLQASANIARERSTEHTPREVA